MSNRCDTSKNDGAIREAGAASSLLFKDPRVLLYTYFSSVPFFVPLQMKKYSLSAIFHQACLNGGTKRGTYKLIDRGTGIKNPLIKCIIAENSFSPATRVPWHLIVYRVPFQSRFPRRNWNLTGSSIISDSSSLFHRCEVRNIIAARCIRSQFPASFR